MLVATHQGREGGCDRPKADCDRAAGYPPKDPGVAVSSASSIDSQTSPDSELFQEFVPQYYDLGSADATATGGTTGSTTTTTTQGQQSHQIASREYYFSVENLVKDIFLRKKMDAEGYLPVSLIASFHRVKALTSDVGIITTALNDSTEVELSSDKSKVRCRLSPMQWVINDPLTPTKHELSYDSPEFIPGKPYPYTSSYNQDTGEYRTLHF
nr:la-related protein 1B-like [Lytechinus pictus]